MQIINKFLKVSIIKHLVVCSVNSLPYSPSFSLVLPTLVSQTQLCPLSTHSQHFHVSSLWLTSHNFLYLTLFNFILSFFNSSFSSCICKTLDSSMFNFSSIVDNISWLIWIRFSLRSSFVIVWSSIFYIFVFAVH